MGEGASTARYTHSYTNQPLAPPQRALAALILITTNPTQAAPATKRGAGLLSSIGKLTSAASKASTASAHQIQS